MWAGLPVTTPRVNSESEGGAVSRFRCFAH
jgi:hypothetical protein